MTTKNTNKVIKAGRVIICEGYKFTCIVEEIILPKEITKEYMMELCREGFFKDINP